MSCKPTHLSTQPFDPPWAKRSISKSTKRARLDLSWRSLRFIYFILFFFFPSLPTAYADLCHNPFYRLLNTTWAFWTGDGGLRGIWLNSSFDHMLGNMTWHKVCGIHNSVAVSSETRVLLVSCCQEGLAPERPRNVVQGMWNKKQSGMECNAKVSWAGEMNHTSLLPISQAETTHECFRYIAIDGVCMCDPQTTFGSAAQPCWGGARTEPDAGWMRVRTVAVGINKKNV